MQSTFAPIELGKRGLIAHSVALQTVGHNMSNAAVEGYSRQRVEMKASPPLYSPDLTREETPGQIGQGVEVASIERLKDMILEGRIDAQSSIEGFWDSRDKYILQLEQVYNEPTESSVRTLMDKFWAGWQELSVNPSDLAARNAVLEAGKALIDGIHNRFQRLSDVRDNLESEVTGTVAQVNELATQIAALNEEIFKVQAMKDNPNDLMDRRDILVGQLASLVNISISTRDPDEFVISTGGMHLVQGKHHEELVTEPDVNNEGYSRVLWSNTRELADIRSGKLASVLQVRDGDARTEIQNLDQMTETFIDLVNEVHRSGYSMGGETGNDFFVEYPYVLNAQGNYDRAGAGTFDSTYLYRVTGSNTLNPEQQIGLAGTITLPGHEGNVQVQYFPTDTVADLVNRINFSGSEVTARLNFQGKLDLQAQPAADPRNPDFVIRGLEDSGQFLVGYAGILNASGPAGAYTWARPDQAAQLRTGQGASYSVAPLTHPSGWITVNPRINADATLVAAAGGVDGKTNGIGDGSIAMDIAQLRTKPVMIGSSAGFDSWFQDRVADIGLRGEEARQTLDTMKLVMKDLTDTRESISGVNMDEEISKMIMYQHGYSAVARFVTTFDSLLDILINRMAV